MLVKIHDQAETETCISGFDDFDTIAGKIILLATLLRDVITRGVN